MALILKRASTHAYGMSWNDDDYNGLADAVAVGRTMKGAARGAAAAQGRGPVLDPPLVARLDAESLLKSVNA